MADDNLPFVVCAEKGKVPEAESLPGNIEAECERCGAVIVHRPHSPSPAHYICTDCFLETVDLDNFQPMVTEETVNELLELQKRKRQ
jgi:hypothetical protein